MMFDKIYPIEEFLRYSEEEFTNEYESDENQRFLNYIENRIRYELIGLINTLDRKGDIIFEVRKKGSLSALNKILKEMRRSGGVGEIRLQEIVKDFIGCRIICVDESALVSTFKALLQYEELTILDSGFELYSAPFRKYENRESRYMRMVTKLGLKEDTGKPTDETKYTNYESLHCYLNFTRAERAWLGSSDKSLNFRATSRENRYIAEAQTLEKLYSEMSEGQRDLIVGFPIECQLRTTLEHLWSSEEHRFVYEKIKSGLISESDPKVGLLRNAFAALKYHYSAIDDLRDVIRNISDKTVEEYSYYYTGANKDISKVRAVYFDSEDKALRLVQEAGELYQSLIGKEGAGVDEDMRKVYSKIYEAYVKIKRQSGEDKGGKI